MVFRKLFWENPYLAELKAAVTGVNNDEVTLDKTVFYAFSGGQASDSGTIGSFNVLEARKEGNEIFYRLENHNLKVGDEVLVKIDWERRYKIMRLHFAAELVLELVNQFYNRPEKIGANISADRARVDFVWSGNISDIFPELLKKFEGIVSSDKEIASGFSDEENEKRYWQIDGFAKVACGGTHIRKTGEIGNVVLKRRHLGENKERVEIYLKN